MMHDAEPQNCTNAIDTKYKKAVQLQGWVQLREQAIFTISKRV